MRDMTSNGGGVRGTREDTAKEIGAIVGVITKFPGLRMEI